MREIIKDGVVLARHIPAEDMKSGLNFFSRDEEFIQAGMWKYEEGKQLSAHIHNELIRTINRTYEVLYIIHGRLKANIYDFNETLVDTLIISQGDVLILLESGHGYEILESQTQVLEVKNGPYLGAEADRRRLAIN